MFELAMVSLLFWPGMHVDCGSKDPASLLLTWMIADCLKVLHFSS